MAEPYSPRRKYVGQTIGQWIGGVIGILLDVGVPDLNTALALAIVSGGMFVGACLGRIAA
jgi:hypothetical protein